VCCVEELGDCVWMRGEESIQIPEIGDTLCSCSEVSLECETVIQ
jgi:hypothetical protein